MPTCTDVVSMIMMRSQTHARATCVLSECTQEHVPELKAVYDSKQQHVARWTEPTSVYAPSSSSAESRSMSPKKISPSSSSLKSTNMSPKKKQKTVLLSHSTNLPGQVGAGHQTSVTTVAVSHPRQQFHLQCLLKWSVAQRRRLHCSSSGMAGIPRSPCEPPGCGRTPLCQSRTPRQPPWRPPPLLCPHCFLQVTLCTKVQS